MHELNIHSINYLYTDHGIVFTYNVDGESRPGHALLQLPHTDQSQHAINGQDLNPDDRQHEAVFNALRHYYDTDHPSPECAAASSAVGSRVHHVQKIDGSELFVAVQSDGKTSYLVEAAYRNYYNCPALYDLSSPNADSNRSTDDVIETAQNICFAWLESLRKALNNAFQETLDKMIPQAEMGAIQSGGPDVHNVFRDALDAFMTQHFSRDYASSLCAVAFLDAYGKLAMENHKAELTNAIALGA